VGGGGGAGRSGVGNKIVSPVTSCREVVGKMERKNERKKERKLKQ
jgi:hypothetical protein